VVPGSVRSVPRSWAILAVAAILAAGCASQDPPAVATPGGSGPSSAPSSPAASPSGGAKGPPPQLGTASSLEPFGTTAVVSIVGHRTSEFMVAHAPANHDVLVATGMDWDGPSQTVQCAAFASADGGGSWDATAVLPGHASAKEETDPWVAISPEGVAYLTCAESGVGLLLSRSSDGGRSWRDATLVPTGGLPIKDAIGAFAGGELLVCFQQGGPLQVIRSTDDGATWTNVSPGGVAAGCNGVARGPDGTTYVLWQGGGTLEADNLSPAPPSFGVLHSRDSGVTWTSVTLDTELGPAPANMQGAPQAAAPSMAVSGRTGTLFVSAQRYQNAEVAGGAGTESQALAVLKRSRDGGATFADLEMPTAFTATCAPAEGAPAGPCNQVHPTLTVDERGRLVLQFSLSDAQSLHKETWVTVSADEGDTWVRPLQLAQSDANASFVSPGNLVPDPQNATKDPAGIPGSAQGRATDMTWPVFHRDGGEYFGITTNARGQAVDLWVQHDASGRNQIRAQRVTILD
jgi:hypothetical protein